MCWIVLEKSVVEKCREVGVGEKCWKQVQCCKCRQRVL